MNADLEHDVDRRARAAALFRMLAEWDDTFGPVGEDAMAAASAAFDDLDAVASAGDRTDRRLRGSGA